MNNLTQLIYVSSVKNLMAEDELIDLLEAARVANVSHAITGLLLYNDGNFMQVIEGEKNNVEQLLKNLENDIRHTGMIVMLKEEIIRRNFSKWSMGFRDISRENIEGFSSFLKYHASEDEDKILPGKAKTILMSFKEDRALSH